MENVLWLVKWYFSTKQEEFSQYKWLWKAQLKIAWYNPVDRFKVKVTMYLDERACKFIFQLGESSTTIFGNMLDFLKFSQLNLRLGRGGNWHSRILLVQFRLPAFSLDTAWKLAFSCLTICTSFASTSYTLVAIYRGQLTNKPVCIWDMGGNSRGHRDNR